MPFHARRGRAARSTDHGRRGGAAAVARERTLVISHVRRRGVRGGRWRQRRRHGRAVAPALRRWARTGAHEPRDARESRGGRRKRARARAAARVRDGARVAPSAPATARVGALRLCPGRRGRRDARSTDPVTRMCRWRVRTRVSRQSKLGTCKHKKSEE